MATDPEGRKVIPMTERVGRPSAPLGEVGRTGTNSFHGFIQSDEYVPELAGLSGLRTLDKMRRSDGMVKAVLRGLTMPLMAATWTVEPGSDDQRDHDIAEEIEDGLFDGMTTGWAEVLRQVLTFLPLGFSVFEKVWEVRDVDGEQKVMLRKLAPRLQRTIFRMMTDEGGGLTGIEQQVFDTTGPGTIEIDIERLLVFVNDREGAQWMGTSVLRPAYKHWWIKDNLYRIQAMAAERWGVGIPTVTLPPDQSDDENIRKAENILSSLRSHERAYAVWPAGYVFSLITSSTGGGGTMDLEPMISHHDRMIAVSVLAQFLTLGSTQVGSFALSSDQSALFLMVEQAIGDLVCEVINRHLIPEWVDYNYANVGGYPKLTVTNIETRNMEKVLAGLAQAAGAGLITHDADLEDALRDGMGLPLVARDENGDPLGKGGPVGPDALPPGVVDTQAPAVPVPGAAAPSGAATNPGAPVPPQSPSAPAPRLNAALDDLNGGPAMLPNLTIAPSYQAENEQIGKNKQHPASQAPHKFLPARYTHTNGHPRCLMCGAEPLEGDPLHKGGTTAFAFKPWRTLLPPEEHVDFEALDNALKESRARIRDAADTPVQRIINALADRAARAYEHGDPSQLQADAIKFDVSELEAALKAELDNLYTTGAVEVRKEIASQIGKLREDQRATFAREAATVEAYRQAFDEMRAGLAEGSKETLANFAKTVEALAQRPIVVATGNGTSNGNAKWKTIIDPETGAISGLEKIVED